ncbi:unnamed protein product [Lactuca saligna]|uniref:Uncharacterized protein n=1 Tax=Lactuca saligna TaxID=75948 RepID=A0AA35YAQ6_LACSI|nr:unnamed protein product [Lactuca saligna]
MGAVFYNSRQYPPTLLLTADHADRVVSLHTMKLLVMMQYVLCTSLENSPQTIYNQVFRFIIVQEFSPDGKFIVTADCDFKIHVTMLPKKPIDGAHEIQSYCLGHTESLTGNAIVDCSISLTWFINFDMMCLLLLTLYSCHASIFTGRFVSCLAFAWTDIRMKVEIPQDTELVEPLDEACIWRQARGTTTETLGAENKVESMEKICFIFPCSKDLELNLAKSFMSEMGQCTTAYPYNQLLGALVLKNYERQDATLLSWNLMHRVD